MKVEIPADRFVPTERKPDGGRTSRVDLIIAAGLAVATLAIGLYFAPRGFHLGFVDMGHDGYQLRQMIDLSEGAVIFKDTWDQYGPLGGYLSTAGFMAFGRRLLAVKYFVCGWYALIAFMLYMMARRWLNRGLAAFSTILWLGLAPFYQHGVMISPHVYVLFFQTVATFVALRASRLEPRGYAIVGVLAGLSAASKMSMGVSFIASILLYLVLRVVVERRDWRRVASAATATMIGCSSVLGLAAALLWMNGALGDWYLQTVVFPRQFYLDYAQPALKESGVMAGQIPRLLANFVRLQSEQALYWWVIRAVVVVTALVQLVRRRSDNDLLLMACITALLWLGVFASLNFMHQWWTAGLSIAPFVVCIRRAMRRFVHDERAVAWSTAATAILIVATGLVERTNATIVRARTLTETIAQPPMFRGILTDAATKRAFETLYEIIARYRSHHPGTKLVTIDASDGWWNGINESLPFLSFFEGNTHKQPVYWNLPVLSTAIYPHYIQTLWDEVNAEHPLIVEQRTGRYRPLQISGYSVLAAARSDVGHWYVYAQEHDERSQHGESSIYLARDGSTDTGFVEEEASPDLARQLSTSIEGGWRGRARLPPQPGEPIEFSGDFPFVLHDPELAKRTGSLDVYTLPLDLPMARLEGAIEPVSEDPVARADIVRDVTAGAWTVDGEAEARYSYLLEFRAAPIAPSYFVLRGELQEGGLTVGLLDHDRWAGYVNVTRPGPFQVVLQVQKAGRYGVIIANCLETGWWQTGWRYRLRDRLRLAKPGINRFRVTEAGWIQRADHPN